MTDTNWPFLFCDTCKKLSPVVKNDSKYYCMRCGNLFNAKTAGKVVYLDQEEASLRKLFFQKS